MLILKIQGEPLLEATRAWEDWVYNLARPEKTLPLEVNESPSLAAALASRGCGPDRSYLDCQRATDDGCYSNRYQLEVGRLPELSTRFLRGIVRTTDVWVDDDGRDRQYLTRDTGVCADLWPGMLQSEETRHRDVGMGYGLNHAQEPNPRWMSTYARPWLVISHRQYKWRQLE
jgi:hypothetical protein